MIIYDLQSATTRPATCDAANVQLGTLQKTSTVNYWKKVNNPNNKKKTVNKVAESEVKYPTPTP